MFSCFNCFTVNDSKSNNTKLNNYKPINYETNDKLAIFDLNGIEIDVFVDSVYDGDTIHVSVPIELNVHSYTENKIATANNERNIKLYKISIRLLGIDTPEMKPRLNIPNRDEHIAKAKEAKKYLADLIEKKIIRVKFSKNEKFGRCLGTIFVNNENINIKMIELGHAKPYDGGTKT